MWRKITRNTSGRHFVPNVILDTGPLVALFKRNDRYHAPAVEWFKRNRAQLLTTLPVLTEAWHLVAPSSRLKLTAFAASALSVPDLGEDAVSHIHGLVARYVDHPIDFADASVMLLAERTGVLSIVTIDVGDFSAYRLPSGKRLQLIFE